MQENCIEWMGISAMDVGRWNSLSINYSRYREANIKFVNNFKTSIIHFNCQFALENHQHFKFSIRIAAKMDSWNSPFILFLS